VIDWKGARRFSGGPLFSLLTLALACVSAPAQDLKTVTSPDGQIEFRIFLANQEDTTLFRLAYEVSYRGKPLIATSFMCFDIWEQEPLLGENVGMTTSSVESKPDYNGFRGRYLQNGSLGRTFEVEARVYNGGVAFRYHLLKSMPMAELFISEETTEFSIGVPVPETADIPYRVERPGVGWMEISEVPRKGFPTMSLAKSSPTALVSRLSRTSGKLRYVYAGTTPTTTPWRIISIGATGSVVRSASFPAQLPQ
jgi:hypothetical protein